MTLISDHHSSKITKALFLGESGTGKTGALCALAEVGYNLRVLDFDNKADIIRGFLTDERGRYWDGGRAKSRVSVKTLTEPMRVKVTAGTPSIGPSRASAWPEGLGLLAGWREGEADYGPVTTWGEREVLVLDSTTSASEAAWNYYCQINGKLGSEPSGYEYMRWMGEAQDLVENLFKFLLSDEVKCNVVVVCHIIYVPDPDVPVPEGVRKAILDAEDSLADPFARKAKDAAIAAWRDYGPKVGMPMALGRALSPKIPRMFPTVLLAKKVAQGTGVRHKIFTTTYQNIGLISTAPLRVNKEYPLETGLADYFKAVRT